MFEELPGRSPVVDTGGELETLCSMLDFLRSTVEYKVADLTDEQGSSAAIPPSALRPAMIVKHLTAVERYWFSIDLAGADLPPLGHEPEAGETLADVLADYRKECDRSRSVVTGSVLDQLAKGPDVHFNGRYALVHMIQETARHCGHLDLLRERIDGRTGQ